MAKKKVPVKPAAAEVFRSRIVGHGEVRAGELLANPFNHREHPEAQRAVVNASLSELGFVKSILVNRRTGHIVDGHERAMQALGEGEDTLVPVEYVDLSDDEERKALLVLDASSEMAIVNADLLQDLASMITFDSAALTGLADSMLADLGKFREAKPEEDDLPEPAPEPKTKPGDLYLMDGHRLLCGDAENPEDVKRVLMGSSPRLMVTDPPYGVKYDPQWRNDKLLGAGRDGKVLENDDKADWTKAYKLFPGDVAYVWHSALCTGDFFLSLQRAGFEIRSQVLWVKPFPIISQGHYHWQHESAFVASKGDPSVEPEAPESELAWYAVRKGGKAYWCGGRRRSTIWECGFAGEAKTGHGTQKPVELIARAIVNHGAPGDVIYDPFLGSGTSIIAAEKTGRWCRGLEIDPVYCDLIVSRWEAYSGKKAILERAQ